MAKTRRSSKKMRKTRKSKGPSEWSAAVKRVYGELKKKNPNARLGDAMKEASRRRKNGTL